MRTALACLALAKGIWQGADMKPVDSKQRLGAVAMAIGITFSIVWALSSYAYERPVETGFVQTVAKPTAKGCS